jgi:hypothetical protein
MLRIRWIMMFLGWFGGGRGESGFFDGFVVDGDILSLSLAYCGGHCRGCAWVKVDRYPITVDSIQYIPILGRRKKWKI